MLTKMISNCSWRLLTVLTAGIVIAVADAQNDGPIITPNVNEVILKKGQNYTIKCKSNTPIHLKQQEISEDLIGPFNMSQRELESVDNEYRYEIALDLFNVDEFAVGYYACFDDIFKENIRLTNFMEEPLNTEHVSYIYLYVNETDSAFAPMSEFIRSRSGSKVVIECRPTTPDVNVTLIGLQSNKTPVFEKYSPKIGFLMKARSFLYKRYNCTGTRGLQKSTKVVRYRNSNAPPKPNIDKAPREFIEGESFSLNCTVEYQPNSLVILTWIYPSNLSKVFVKIDTNENNTTGGIVYNAITVVNASKSASGTYTCMSESGYHTNQNKTHEKIYLGTKGFITMTKKDKEKVIETKLGVHNFRIIVNSYPEAEFKCLKNNEPLLITRPKYELSCCQHGALLFSIRKLELNDTANYTIIATNKYDTKNVTFDLRKKASPEIVEFPNYNKKYLQGQTVSLVCKVTGYPPPSIKWLFHNDEGKEQVLLGKYTSESIIKVSSTLNIPAYASGNITCVAENNMGPVSLSKPFLVYEVPNGFGVQDSDETRFSQDQNVTKLCYASKYDFENVTWIKEGSNKQLNVRKDETEYSYVAQLDIENISLEDAGNYTCVAVTGDTEYDTQTIFITVAARKTPVITIPIQDTDVKANPYQRLRFSCQASAVPPPSISWYKDDKELSSTSKLEIMYDSLDYSTVNSTVIIEDMSKKYMGDYKCEVTSGVAKVSRLYHLILNETFANPDEHTNKLTYLTITGVTVFLLIVVIVYLAWKIRKDKQFKKELQAAGLINFKKGATKSINPELGIDEQAELLPYDERFEFPPEKLKLGKQLGEGAFGVVYKAEARGIINAEETTPVAVKMVKKTADNMFIKALASELKIMVHLGKHINIVNLLGACTKKVGKRELIVIVEYCKFGNIHNYMQRHREVFIDQLTDNKEKNLGRVNKAFSSSSASSGMHSDYFGSNHSQETDHTCVNTANTNRSARKDNTNQHVELVKVSETGYVQPEWRSNYVSDYSYDDGRTPRPLTSRDLMAWAFQIARGMEYLANRKVLHGDLAARNVLLAEDNIIKICDFGLARSIYKNDEYKKQENSPLPVKWLAIECMTDRIFSTQSDVWSFGVVLWELFSLAKNPYPNVSPRSLIQWLSDGHRLEKPRYADDRLYGVMQQCWQQKPTARPTFSQLQEMLGSFLEDNVRNHYVDLNSAYVESNVKNVGHEDYLEMVCGPDYNNLVTPSPHHYANDSSRSFFPPTPLQLAHDDEGYLQMSPATSQTPFSPRYAVNEFDFDARKLQFRPSDVNSLGSERTPMLTLNNLPARGSSESDLDGNVSSYISMVCPRIDEETDEVFETKQYNMKNALNKNSAVSNPTYTLDVDLEKKPTNISNYYINVNVPNGLVK